MKKFQFSLATLFIVLTVFCIFIADPAGIVYFLIVSLPFAFILALMILMLLLRQ